MQIHGIPVNLKLNSTVLMIASFVISVLAGLILNLAGAGRGVYVMLYSAGMAYLKLLFLLALPIVFLNLVSGVMQRLQLRSDGSSPARYPGRFCRFFRFRPALAPARCAMGAAAVGADRCRCGENRTGGRRSPQAVPFPGGCVCLCGNPVAAFAAFGSVFPPLSHDRDPGAGRSVARCETGPGYGFLLCGLWNVGLRIPAASLRQRLPGAFPAQLQAGSAAGLYRLLFRFRGRGGPAQSAAHGDCRRSGPDGLVLRKTAGQNRHGAVSGNCLYAGGSVCWHAGICFFFLCWGCRCVLRFRC